MNTRLAYARMDSPVGPVWVATTKMGLCAVGLGAGQPGAFFAWLARHISPEPPREDPEALAPALAQLGEYFSRTRRKFDLPLDVRGTAFQKAVWAQVTSIPYGTTTTYGEIAQRIGRPRAARAVGAANGANPLPILIPCHRVIGARGSLTGYGGGLEVKATLLRLEGTVPHQHAGDRR
ncbi:MAG: methylated-DNA--[protein]-cysteine S-methyltransferase [Anaerolineae bacterium]